MSLFSKKPKSIADFEKEIEKLRQKKKLSARNSERLEEYEKQLSTLKTAEEAAQKKKARQKKIAIGSIAASLALVTCIIIAGCISESGTVESPAVSPGYTISDSANGTTTPSDTGSDNSSSSEASASPTTSNATTPAKESNSSFSPKAELTEIETGGSTSGDWELQPVRAGVPAGLGRCWAGRLGRGFGLYMTLTAKRQASGRKSSSFRPFSLRALLLPLRMSSRFPSGSVCSIWAGKLAA